MIEWEGDGGKEPESLLSCDKDPSQGRRERMARFKRHFKEESVGFVE